MSAIWGVWRRDGKPRVAADLASMTKRLTAYGPDTTDEWTGESVGLGRALAMTLPEDSFDRQPLRLAGGAVMVADIRLDNRGQLARQLAIGSGAASEMADARLLGAAWERWGEGCLSRLTGEFAFAVWDERYRKLFCARDQFGRRSLYYFVEGPLFAFASVPRGLHALPEATRTVDEAMIAGRLVFLPETGERSLFEKIRKLPPAHCLTVTPERQTVSRYWRLEPDRRIKFARDEDYCEAFRDVLDEAVECRLRGRGPVGTMLSGGFDSGTVAATAARLLAGQGRPLMAFTGVPAPEFNGSVPPERFGNEAQHAAGVAALYPNMRHVLVPPLVACPLDLLARPRFWSDSPGNHPCMTPHAFAMAEAQQRAGLKVVLTAVSGNMTISYHGLPLVTRLAREGHWAAWYREARGLIANARFQWPGVLALSFGHRVPPALWRALHRYRDGNFSQASRYTLLHPRYFKKGGISALATELGWDLAYRPRTDGRLARMADLMRLDQGALAAGGVPTNGVDYRDPTIDKRLVEFCLAIPEEQYLRNGRTKYLLRRAMAGRLPPLVLDEWRKGLAGADWHLRVSPYRGRFAAAVERIAGSPSAQRCLDVPRMRRLVEDWPREWSAAAVQQEYRMGLCRAIQAGEFMRWVEECN